MKSLLVWLFVIGTVCRPGTSNAQSEFEKYKQQQEAEYKAYQQNNTREFTRYRDSLNHEYKQFRDSCIRSLTKLRDSLNIEFGRQLKQKWQKSKMKPPLQPNQFQSAYPSRLYKVDKQATQEEAHDDKFFGQLLDFYIPPKAQFRLKSITEQDIGDAWLHLNQCNLLELVSDCQLVAKAMELNSWGYYQMMCWVSDRIYPPAAKNEKVFFRFFMLTQSNCDCKLGSTAKQMLTLLLPINAKVFLKSYQEYEGIVYYVMTEDLPDDEVTLYSKKFPKAKRNTDIYLRHSPKLRKDNVVVKTFKTQSPNLQIKLPVNKYLIDYYNTYPLCQLNVYSPTIPDPDLANNIRKQFEPLLASTDKEVRITRLLEFMHKTFDYLPDAECWGRERYFFPEEGLFYPYMDCEDYAVLFRFLVSILTDCPSVLLAYPGHVATAITLSQEVKKGYILHNGKKYTLCDPTYKGAIPGQLMPCAKGEVRIVSQQNP